MNASQMVFDKLKDLTDGRVYPLQITEHGDDTPPYIIYQQISATPINTVDGITHHERVRMQIDVYHVDYDEMITLASQVVSLLDELDSSTHDSTNYSYDSGLYRASIDYLLSHTIKELSDD